MHDLGILVPIAAITIGPIAWAFNNWNRLRHGFEPESWKSRRQRRGDETLDAERKVTLLTGENERLNGQVARLEERIAVLERIATDPAERTARAIDALRLSSASPVIFTMIVFLAALAAATACGVFLTERVDRPRRRAGQSAEPHADPSRPDRA